MTKRTPAKKKVVRKQSAAPEKIENKEIVHIGQRCEEIRNSLSISRRDMAEICGGVSYQMILSFERNQIGSVTLLTQYLTHLFEVARINPSWVVLADNKHISKYVRTYADIARQVEELTKGTSVDGV